jgi:signal transduction histidine kinase
LQAAGARAVLTTEPDRSERALEAIQDVGTECIRDLRRLLGLLRSAGEDSGGSLDRLPSLDDLNDLLDKTHRTGLTITRTVEGTPARLDPSVALTAYRVTQEALTNTIKYAGAGAVARVDLAWTCDELVLTIEDQAAHDTGSGAPAPDLSTGHGLLGLRERVTTAGGRFEARPTGAGFLVRAVLPVSTQALPATVQPPSTRKILSR